MSLRLTAAVSATDATIQKKYGSGMITLIISNKEMKGFTKILKYIEEYDLLMKGVSKITVN